MSYADTFREYFNSLGCAVVKISFLSKETKEQAAEKLRRADIIYLGRGDTAESLNTFKSTKLIDITIRDLEAVIIQTNHTGNVLDAKMVKA